MVNAKTARGRTGFTLIEIIIAMAILAILAGAVTPLVFKELVRAREEATEIELNALQEGLLNFYEDTGRFPSESEGLVALIVDPGLAGWAGPYVASERIDPAEDVGEDSFGDPYLYDLAPATNPPGSADVIVASGGADHLVTFGSVGGTWNVSAAGDDLLALVSTGPMNRNKIAVGERELEALGEASRHYYEENRTFASDPNDLADNYLDRGLDGDALIDPWNRPYELNIDNSGDTPVLTVLSYGPDRLDDGGGDDDLMLSVSSVPPGRKTTRYLLAIAQTVLNENSSLVLSSNWAAVRADLGLADAFAQDGWARDFQINDTSRTVYSAGPDGNPGTTADNIPAGVGPATGGGGGGGGGGGAGGGAGSGSGNGNGSG